MCYRSMERWVDAVAVFERIRERFESVFGKDREDTLKLLEGLAVGYLKANQKLDVARKLFEELMARTKASYGANDFRVLAKQASIGVLYCSNGQTAEGLPLIERAYESGKNDSRLFGIADQLLVEFAKVHRREDATRIMCEVMRIQFATKELPPDGPTFAIFLSALGPPMLEQQRWESAAVILRESLDQHEKFAVDSATTRIVSWQVDNVKSMLVPR